MSEEKVNGQYCACSTLYHLYYSTVLYLYSASMDITCCKCCCVLKNYSNFHHLLHYSSYLHRDIVWLWLCGPVCVLYGGNFGIDHKVQEVGASLALLESCWGLLGWCSVGVGRLPAGVHLAGEGWCSRPAVALGVPLCVIVGHCWCSGSGGGTTAWLGAIWLSAS